ncbi:MAG TPA: MerR family transcriptional regulator [Syntrophomonas sp.]|jgi:DNA-binding transcriptional MerR regulator|nr:MerR family transcriptional regulator [Syntrophomonas sp.]
MLISEVSKATNLTKKAIEYYINQGLGFPEILENGYKYFNENDVEHLKKISVFRKIGLGTDDIKAILADEKGEVLQKIAVQKELCVQREKAKQAILDQLSIGKSFAEIETTLNAIEQNQTVTDKLLEAFPGFYGRFICLHFARFLNEPISPPQQQAAYKAIIEFLDEVPALTFPKDLQDFLLENTRHISAENIGEMNEQTKRSVENPEQFLSENREMLTWYLEYKKSDEYKNSPAFKIQEMLKEFNQTSGYYNVFIPAMKRLSGSYAEYYQQLEIANEKILSKYPEITRLDNGCLIRN